MLETVVRRLFGDRRRIFSFHDGSKWRRVDPLAVEDRLDELCPKWQEHLRTIAAPDCPMPGPVLDNQTKDKKAATSELIEVTRKVFDIKPLTDDEGLTSSETIKVFSEYMNYMGKLVDAIRPTSG